MEANPRTRYGQSSENVESYKNNVSLYKNNHYYLGFMPKK